MIVGIPDREYEDRSGEGCTMRIVRCRGEAEAEDKDKSTAIDQAKDEAKRQMELAVGEAESAIDCPTNGCTRGSCTEVGDWYVGENAGYDVKTKKLPGNVWHAFVEWKTERRLRCECL